MLGSIIGDLAAWTYEHDQALFYSKLISEEATLSEYGLTTLATAAAFDANVQDRNTYKEHTRQWFRMFSNDVVELSSDAQEWASVQDFINGSLVNGMLLLRSVVGSWWNAENFSDLNFESHIEKEETYAISFVKKMITLLKVGFTKDEVLEDLGDVFKECRNKWDWKRQETLIPYVLRAWEAFYTAFDFGSSLHNAMRMEGNKRLLGALTGAIAEAMYGCRTYFIKQKYVKDNSTGAYEITLPQPIQERYGSTLQIIKLQKHRVNVFWPKNDSRTNVEQHRFSTVNNGFKEKIISEDLKNRIIKSFEPDWENRYSFYLDNGWVYVCRSFVLICRFRFQQHQDGTYFISRLQKSEEGIQYETALEEALYSAKKVRIDYKAPY